MTSAYTLAQDEATGVVESAERLRIVADVVYGHKDGLAMTYDVIVPAEANGAGLLYMVSGGWFSRWEAPERVAEGFAAFLDEGYTLFVVRHGSSPRYNIPEIAVDVEKALKHIHGKLDEFDVDAKRLGVFGFSAGGHLSLLLGTKSNQRTGANDPHVAAVCAVFPPTDLEPYVNSAELSGNFPALKFEPELARDLSPLFQVSSDDAPTLLVHGDKDELVPIWHSEKIAAAFEESGVPNRLVVIEGAAHGFDEAGNKRMVEAMLEWFENYLEHKTESVAR